MTQARTANSSGLAVKAALLLVPIAVIFAARLATHSALAAEYPRIAAALFLWVTADALALATIAKAPGNRPGLKPVIGAVAAASGLVALTAAEPVRSALFSMHAVITAMGLTVAVYLGWTCAKAVQIWRAIGSIEAAFGHIMPPRFVRFLKIELAVVWLGLFRWNAPADAPPGTQAFAYHTYLTPMVATFLALQIIELSVVHLLVTLWNETVAWVLFGLSIWVWSGWSPL